MAGDNMILATIVPRNNTKAYASLVDVDDFIEGHAAQHKLHAADVQQHANCRGVGEKFRGG